MKESKWDWVRSHIVSCIMKSTQTTIHPEDMPKFGTSRRVFSSSQLQEAKASEVMIPIGINHDGSPIPEAYVLTYGWNGSIQALESVLTLPTVIVDRMHKGEFKHVSWDITATKNPVTGEMSDIRIDRLDLLTNDVPAGDNATEIHFLESGKGRMFMEMSSLSLTECNECSFRAKECHECKEGSRFMAVPKQPDVTNPATPCDGGVCMSTPKFSEGAEPQVTCGSEVQKKLTEAETANKALKDQVHALEEAVTKITKNRDEIAQTITLKAKEASTNTKTEIIEKVNEQLKWLPFGQAIRFKVELRKALEGDANE